MTIPKTANEKQSCQKIENAKKTAAKIQQTAKLKISF
jgi:hypothetical protein